MYTIKHNHQLMEIDMTAAEEKKEKILASIASRGWATCEIYWIEACELKSAGLIRQTFKHTTGGNQKPVWVAV